MSTYDESLLAARFAALAPEPLAGDWDDVLRRADATRENRQPLERSRGREGHPRRFLVVLAAAILVVVVGTAAAYGIRSFILEQGFIGLPPEGATPSSPASGELEIYYWVTGDPGNKPGDGPRITAWMYSDGRLISLRYGSDLPESANPLFTGFLEQRLTPDGVELFRSEIVSTGLFDHHQPARREASPHSVIQVRIGERLVRVQVGCPGCPANFPEGLGERVADAASWLPASAWKDRQMRAYVASRYAISYFAQPQALERSRVLSLLPAAAEDLLRAKDAVSEQWVQSDHYVSDLTTEEARALAQALDDAGLKPQKRANELFYVFEPSGKSLDRPFPEKGHVGNVVFIYFEPTLPDGEHVCSACG